MEQVIVDTSVLVSLERDEDRVDALLGEAPGEVAIAAVTVAELVVGGLLASTAHREQRAAFVEGLLERVRIEPYTEAVAREHARLMVAARRSGTPRAAHDLQIAATAAHTGRVVVTHDLAGFRDLPGVDARVA